MAAFYYDESFQRSAINIPKTEDCWRFVALRINFILRRDVTFGHFLCVAAAVNVEILDLAFSSSLPVPRPVVKRLSPPPLLTFVTTLELVRSDSYELRCT